jgi:hypothetical protein
MALSDDFAKFQQLDPKKDGEARKNIVHRMEAAVKTNEIDVLSQDAQRYLHGELELPRILVYLLIENAKLNSDLLSRRNNVLSEWERLRRNLAHETSRMPLYYAVRAYLTLLRGGSPDMRAKARDDRKLIEEIHAALSQSIIDQESALIKRISELLYIVKSDEDASSNPTVAAAFIQRNGAVLAAVIAAFVAIAVAVIGNWDKLANSARQTAPSSQSKP